MPGQDLTEEGTEALSVGEGSSFAEVRGYAVHALVCHLACAALLSLLKQYTE